MNITWRTHEPNDKEKEFLEKELRRLKELQSYVTDTANKLEAAVERDTCLEYYRSLTLALVSATNSSMQADTCDDIVADSDADSPTDGEKPAQSLSYKDVDWDDLSQEGRNAATILGYNKKSWNANMFIDVEDTSWNDLTKEQIAAATVLGWNRASWDGAGDNKEQSKDAKKEARKWMACNDYERIPHEYQVIDRHRSHYQSMKVFYGRQEDDACLYMDNYLHTCASFRAHYHEVCVHYPARFIDQVKRVLYIGGGDSMVLHEVLKYPTLELVVGLELDQSVSRIAFKNFGAQPHFDNEKVQWWFGDAAESLLLLPTEYYGSFDLVIIDIRTIVAKTLKVNDELNIIDAAMLLMNSNGIIVKNEDEGYVPGSTSNYMDYSVDLLYYDVPLYCLQALVVGSNAVNFVNTKPKDHKIETIYLGGVDKFQDHFDSWYNFGMETRRSISACQSKHDETAKESTKPLGVLLVLEAENIMIPLDSETNVKSMIIKALDNVGLQVITSTSIPRSRDDAGFTLVILVPQGYIVARFFSRLQYCAFDVKLWGASVAKLDHVKSELVEVVQSKNASSYRMITGGMMGVHHIGVENVGPPSANMLCKDSKLNLTDAKIRNEKQADAFELPQATTLHDYNLTLPIAQWHSQAPIGAQTLIQFEVPPLMVGEKVLVNQDGSFVPGTVVSIQDNGDYTVLTEDKDIFISDVTASRIKKLTDEKLDRPFMYAFLKEILSDVYQSVQKLMDTDEDPPHNEIYQDIGDGLAIVAVASQYSIIATWDGGSFIDFNLFLESTAIDFPFLLFNSARNKEKLGHWRLTRRDDFPRGTGSVVNFKSEIADPPAWVESGTNESRSSNESPTIRTKETEEL
jgi:spermidine synthase